MSQDHGPFTIEIADHPETRQRGLMDRLTLQGVDGMLFLFDAPTNAPFWNWRTLLPLDLFFADDHGRVVDRLAMQSIGETRGRILQYAPRAPYVAALEVLRGRAPADVSRIVFSPGYDGRGTVHLLGGGSP